MTSPFQYGAYKYESTESRALKSFGSDKFDYKDQEKNLIQLNNAVGYMSEYMRKMQKGIDEANENFIQQIQSFINDIIVLLGGGGDTGFDFGDLKYVFQMFGALFGFDTGSGIPLPLNVFQAVWHMISTYVLPTGNFEEAINAIIDSAIASILDILGDVPILGQALQQLAVIISNIRDGLGPIIDIVDGIMDALGGFGGAGPDDLLGGIFGQLGDLISLDFSGPGQFIESLIDALLNIPSFIIGLISKGLLGTDSPLNGANLFGDIAANLINGVLNIFNIPNLDAGKIISGTFLDSLIPGLDVSKIVSGIFNVLRIPNLDAGKIISGTFLDSLIPGLDVSKIVSGVFNVFRIPNLSADKITSGQFGQNMITDLISDLGSMLTGVKTGADGTDTGTSGTLIDQINQAKDSLLGLLGLSRNALNSAIAAQVTLQEQENGQNTGDGGVKYNFIFSGADGAALNSGDWTTGATSGDVTIRGSSGYAGIKNGNGDGYYFASPNYDYATDGQSASFVLGDTDNGSGYSGIYIRCNATRTEGAYCLVKDGEARIGKFTRSGGSFSFASPLTTQTGQTAIKSGARIEFLCSGSNYFVYANGRLIISATDSGNTITVGATARKAMFTMQRWTYLFWTYDSYKIASFAMSDYAAGGGGISMANSWFVSRSSTTNATFSAISSGPFPASFFTFQNYANDVTVANLGTAQITIAQSGLYTICCTYRSVTAKGTSTPYYVLYVNGSRKTGAISPGQPFELLLNAGDTVQPGMIAIDYDIRSDGSTGSERVVARSITGCSGVASFSGRRVA